MATTLTTVERHAQEKEDNLRPRQSFGSTQPHIGLAPMWGIFFGPYSLRLAPRPAAKASRNFPAAPAVFYICQLECLTMGKLPYGVIHGCNQAVTPGCSRTGIYAGMPQRLHSAQGSPSVVREPSCSRDTAMP